jgi:hypothetical protein
MIRMQQARRMTSELPIGSDPRSVRRRIEALENLLEGSIPLPVIGRKVGLDAVAGLVPVAGDLITGALGLYLIWEARNLGLPKWRMWQMIANVGIDTALGAVPVVGDLFDFLFRSNSVNLRIINRHLDRRHPATRTIEG